MILMCRYCCFFCDDVDNQNKKKNKKKKNKRKKKAWRDWPRSLLSASVFFPGAIPLKTIKDVNNNFVEFLGTVYQRTQEYFFDSEWFKSSSVETLLSIPLLCKIHLIVSTKFPFLQNPVNSKGFEKKRRSDVDKEAGKLRHDNDAMVFPAGGAFLAKNRKIMEVLSAISDFQARRMKARESKEVSIYIPISHDNIEGSLESLFQKVLQLIEEVKFDVASALLLGQIGLIHPFSDGNGRVSRILTNLVLNKCRQPCIYFGDEPAYTDSFCQLNKSATCFTISAGLGSWCQFK